MLRVTLIEGCKVSHGNLKAKAKSDVHMQGQGFVVIASETVEGKAKHPERYQVGGRWWAVVLSKLSFRCMMRQQRV